jgi:hypothetical protein
VLSCWWRRPWVAAPSAAPGRTAVVAIDHPLHFGHRAAGRAESTADNGLDTKDHSRRAVRREPWTGGTRTRPQRVCCGAPRSNCEQANARPERSATGQVRQCRHSARPGSRDQHLVAVLQVDQLDGSEAGSVVTKKSHPSRPAGLSHRPSRTPARSAL